MRNQLVELQLARHVEVHDARDVRARTGGPEAGELQLLAPAHELPPRNLEHRVVRHHAQDEARAARAQRAERLERHLRDADDLERVVDTAAAELADGLDRVAFGGVHGVRCAELLGQPQLAVEQVDGDHLLGPRERRSLHDVQADTAAPEDGDPGAGLHLRVVEHSRHACRDPATHERDLVERRVFANRDRARLRDDRVLGERGDE